jgi:hypothetical protein
VFGVTVYKFFDRYSRLRAVASDMEAAGCLEGFGVPFPRKQRFAGVAANEEAQAQRGCAHGLHTAAQRTASIPQGARCQLLAAPAPAPGPGGLLQQRRLQLRVPTMLTYSPRCAMSAATICSSTTQPFSQTRRWVVRCAHRVVALRVVVHISFVLRVTTPSSEGAGVPG